MKKNIFLALPLILTSCATPTPPPVAFHKTDSTMLVIRSLDVHTCQILQPTTTTEEETAKFLEQAKSLKQRQTAVVILEKYTDSSIGNQFRDRGTDWFVALRGLGYEHIYFLQGRNVTDPEGLLTICHYD